MNRPASTSTVDVERAAGGRGWTISWRAKEHPATELPTKDLAVTEAARQLSEHPGGGKLVIYYADGRQQTERTIRSAAPASQLGAERFNVFRDTINREGVTVDKVLSHTDKVLSVVGLISAPTVSTLISPEVQGALGDGWPAVFFATLTFCLGVAGSTALIIKTGFAGMQTFFAIALIFIVALAIANALGTGALDIEPALTEPDTHIVERLAGVVAVAIETYGPLGAAISAGVGVWIGERAARLL